MNCKSIQNQISAYLDRELPGDEMLAVRQHLSECESCREELEALRTLKHFLVQAPVPEPPADFADRLCAAVLSQDRPQAIPERKAAFRVSFVTFAGVAACSMALTFAFLSTLHPAPSAKGVATTSQVADAKNLAFEVQRDQVYSVGLDATMGAPVLSSAQDNVHP